MWQQYTRETPARPGLAVIITTLALAATIGAAALYEGSPTTAVFEFAEDSPPGWPISFDLFDRSIPIGGWTDFGVGAPPSTTLDSGPDLLTQPLHFVGSPPGAGFGSVAYVHPADEKLSGGFAYFVEFRLLPADVTLSDACIAMTGRKYDEGEAMRVGPLDAIMIHSTTQRFGVRLSVVAVSETGLAIRIEYMSPLGESQALRNLLELCGSVKIVPWSCPR